MYIFFLSNQSLAGSCHLAVRSFILGLGVHDRTSSLSLYCLCTTWDVQLWTAVLRLTISEAANSQPQFCVSSNLATNTAEAHDDQQASSISFLVQTRVIERDLKRVSNIHFHRNNVRSTYKLKFFQTKRMLILQ